MRQTRDSFLRFLSDNLPGTKIHAVRRSTTEVDGDKLEMNAVNVKFLASDFSIHISDQLVVIDVVHEDELSAVDLYTQLWQILNKRAYIQKYDYTDPQNPVAVDNVVVYWEPTVRFIPIFNPAYSHWHCTIHLKHHIP